RIQPETSTARRNAPGDQHDSIDCVLVRSHTAKILGSPSFSGSERMSRFLRFVVESALAGRGAELKEYVLGIEIFDRKETFDPRIDPIVRVEARRLRSKLKAYYEGEGAADPMIIEMPTGSYVPRFRQRDRLGGNATVSAPGLPRAPQV